MKASFGRSLRGRENGGLRRTVLAWATTTGGGVRADSLPALHRRLRRDRTLPRPAPLHLIFDLHRIVLYRPPPARERQGLESLVRGLVDAYPVQPAELLLEGTPDGPYRFLYAPEVLEVLPLLHAASGPDRIAVADLLTGEIRSSGVWPHPACGGAPRTLSAAEVVPPRPLDLEPRAVGPALREGGAPDAAPWISPFTGPVRQVIERRDLDSLPFASTRIAWSGGRRWEGCHGKALLPSAAASVATCEALERYQTVFRRPDERLVHGRYEELREHAVDPRDLFFGPASPPMYWTWATEPLTARTVLVPAQEVWYNTDRLPEEDRVVDTTTNACALGRSLEEASIFALFEAIERDSFLLMWYLRRRCRKIDPDSIRDERFQLLRRHWQRIFPDHDLRLLDLSTDVAVPSVAAVAVRRRGDGPRTLHAAACRSRTAAACSAAVRDLTNFPPRLTRADRARYAPLPHEPERIRGPEDHFGLFAMDEAYDRLSFLNLESEPDVDAEEIDGRGPLRRVGERNDLRALLFDLAAHLRGCGIRVLLKDVTHPAVAERGLRCVRAVCPGTFPIWFGPAAKRFAETDRLRRLGAEPSFAATTAGHGYNLRTHPLS